MTTPDFSRRSDQSEILDGDDIDFETFRAVLADLAKVNRLTFAYRPTMQFFKRLAQSGRWPAGRTMTVVDVGSGYGDMLRKVQRWGARRGLTLDLVGIDRNAFSARAAEQAAPRHDAIRFLSADIFDYRPERPIDIVISSLLTHHLTQDQLVRFVSWMEANTALGWFVNDIHRHPLAYHLFGFGTAALRFHPIVRHDGMVSITRAFVPADWQRVLATAGIPAGAASISRIFPFRLCVSRIKAA